jgi:threonylcarbamoyladenosine tRNA methylthiotransferase MtaB
VKKVAFYTLGCKLNFSETSTISRQFEEKGFLKVDFQESPDIFIINTCSVTDNADKKCKKLVKEAKKISPDSYVAIIGCYAQLKPTEIAEIEGVDAVLGAAEKFRLIELLDGFAKEQETKVLASEISAANSFETSYSLHDRTRTFLKVQDGCNYGCAFCTIPLARGKSRSSTIDSILASARDIAANNRHALHERNTVGHKPKVLLLVGANAPSLIHELRIALSAGVAELPLIPEVLQPLLEHVHDVWQSFHLRAKGQVLLIRL